MNDEKNSGMRQRAAKIEALLFALGKPLARVELAAMLSVSAEEIEQALTLLVEQGKENDRGIVLVDDGQHVELRTAPAAAELIEKVRREEFSRELGRSGAEVIAILLYQGLATRTQIDFIRGVNSSQALRTLSVRGLVRKAASPNSQRSMAYELTTDALAALGISRFLEAPEFEEIREKLNGLQA